MTRRLNTKAASGHNTEKYLTADNMDQLRDRAERPKPGRMYELHRVINKPDQFIAITPILVMVDKVTKNFCAFHSPATGMKGRVYLSSNDLVCLFIPSHKRKG